MARTEITFTSSKCDFSIRVWAGVTCPTDDASATVALAGNSVTAGVKRASGVAVTRKALF